VQETLANLQLLVQLQVMKLSSVTLWYVPPIVLTQMLMTWHRYQKWTAWWH